MFRGLEQSLKFAEKAINKAVHQAGMDNDQSRRRREQQEERQRRQQEQQQRRLEAQQRRFEAQQRAEQQRLEAQQRRLEAQQRAHQQRMEAQQRRLEAQQRMEAERVRLEAERVRLEAERQARAQAEQDARDEAEKDRLREEAEAARAQAEEAERKAREAEAAKAEAVRQAEEEARAEVEAEREAEREAEHKAQEEAEAAAAKAEEERKAQEAAREEEAGDIADILRNAMEGWGTDEAALISACCSLDDDMAARVRARYEAEHGRDLLQDLRDETRGNFETVLVGIFMTRAELDATMIRNSIKGLGTRETELSQVVCQATDEELRAAATAFRKMFELVMVDEVRDDVGSSKYGRLIMGVLEGALGESGRDECLDDPEAVEVDVLRLFKAAEGFGVESKIFIEVFAKGRGHLARVAEAYPKKYGKSLRKMIESEFKGDMRYALVALVTPRPVFISDTLHDAMKGVGASGEVIARVLVRHRGDALRAASDHFVQKHEGTIAHWLDGEHSLNGNFKKSAIAIAKNWQ